VAACLFCEIVTGKRPAHVVYDTADTLVFLDVRPVFPGHCLVVPRSHVEVLPELPDALVGPLFTTVRRMARAVEGAMDAHGTFVAMNNRVSQSVPHLHVHVVPRRFKDGLRGFFWPRLKYESEEAMAETAARIRAAVSLD
jgi:histidine triad (HIT) family protein